MAATNDDHMPASAYNAYLKSTDPVERGNALFLIGRDYDRHDKQKEALAAFQAGLALTPSAGGRRAGRAAEAAGRVPRHQGRRSRRNPRRRRPACASTSKIAVKGDVSYAAFVRSEPAFDGIVTGARRHALRQRLAARRDLRAAAARRLSGRERRANRRDLHRARRRPRPQAVDQLCRQPAMSCRERILPGCRSRPSISTGSSSGCCRSTSATWCRASTPKSSR